MSRLAVLLPARNCAEDLPGWFSNVEQFADVVVALDDGSSDDTAQLLDAHPLTARLLRNPPRPGYAGWDDRANRQALLVACEELEVEVDWILQLDADERLPEADAAALRRAIDHDALDPTAGYLLQVHRMVDGDDGFDENHLWVGRLFANRPGLELPEEKLHLVPLPVTIPSERQLRTTLRILHLGSHTESRRAARVAKYREADPEHRWQAGYENLGAPPGEIRRVEPRPPSLPVVPHTPWPGAAADAADHPEGHPMLSVVVISRDDQETIARALDAIMGQVCTWPFEVIVVTSGTDRTAEIVGDQFPKARLVVIDHPALPGEARNAGLAVAQGRYVTFPGSHIELVPGSLQARVDRHLEGWALVAGNVHNGTTTAAGWATYFVDHAGSLPDRPGEVLPVAPGACSYLRSCLDAVGGFPEDFRTAEDTVVNTALFTAGFGAFRDQDAAYIHHSRCRTVTDVVRHHHKRGRGLGQMLIRATPPDRPLLTRNRLLSLGLRYIPGRIHRIHHYTWRYGGPLRGRWLTVAPIASLAVVAAWAGAWRELLWPGPGSLDRLAGSPHGGAVLARRGWQLVRQRIRR